MIFDGGSPDRDEEALLAPISYGLARRFMETTGLPIEECLLCIERDKRGRGYTMHVVRKPKEQPPAPAPPPSPEDVDPGLVEAMQHATDEAPWSWKKIARAALDYLAKRKPPAPPRCPHPAADPEIAEALPNTANWIMASIAHGGLQPAQAQQLIDIITGDLGRPKSWQPSEEEYHRVCMEREWYHSEADRMARQLAALVALPSVPTPSQPRRPSCTACHRHASDNVASELVRRGWHFEIMASDTVALLCPTCWATLESKEPPKVSPGGPLF